MGVKGVWEFVVCFVLAPGSLWFFSAKQLCFFLCSALRFSCVFLCLRLGVCALVCGQPVVPFFVLRFAIQLCFFVLALGVCCFFSAVQLCTFCALKRISKHEQKHKKRTTEIYYGSRKFPQQHPWPCLRPSNRRRSGLGCQGQGAGGGGWRLGGGGGGWG